MMKLKKIAALLTALCLIPGLAGCVDQHPEESTDTTAATAGITAGTEAEATTEAAPAHRIIATSPATVEICDRLGLDLVATCMMNGELPQRYQGLPDSGSPMAPDAEKIVMLEPTDVIGPYAVAEFIEPKYKAAGIPYTFLDLQSVEGMYEGIAMLGEKYGVQEAADKLVSEYEAIMEQFHQKIEGKPRPRVLVLMGLPGAYVESTPNSYVGSLVELAGAECVAQDEVLNFVSWNTEQLLQLDPDIILLTAHGIPDMAMKAFEDEFSTNDIWKHFRAVQEKKVYRLDYQLFNMSCTFEWPQALDALEEILYEGTCEPFDKLPDSAEQAG